MMASTGVDTLPMTDGASTWPFASDGLTARQSTILVLLASGKSNQQIADSLVLGIETVRSHLKSIYTTLDVHTRAEAIVWALRSGQLT